MKYLELLAPARTVDIGIAAINCGADAVYIAGPGFGARKAAANSLEDIGRLCIHAHKFGARVFLTVNTIIYDEELQEVHSMMLRAQEIGVDAFIVQDPAVFLWEDIRIPLHASTQCAVRTPQAAAFYASLGASRLILEREMTLDSIRRIRSAVGCELEFFVHGALCVCYSGQCYMSEHIARRSANRGECIQACRALYDLVDDSGRILCKDKALLSLKDYDLHNRIGDLVEAGITSFKIEGRLKNEIYVKNIVRMYSDAIDAFIALNPGDYARASFGKTSRSFAPNPVRTFNRGFTELYLDGVKSGWSSMDAPKSMGEFVGTVKNFRRVDPLTMEVRLSLSGATSFHNGDGFAFLNGSDIVGFRGDVCRGDTIFCRPVETLYKGARVFRNMDVSFEKELESADCRREIAVSVGISVSGCTVRAVAVSEDGRRVTKEIPSPTQKASNPERMRSLLVEQMSKRSGHYHFVSDGISVDTVDGGIPFFSISAINSLRRELADKLDGIDPISLPLALGKRDNSVRWNGSVTYKENIANRLSRSLMISRGASSVDPAFELSHSCGVELMRTRYCIKAELGLCPRWGGILQTGDLFLVNNGERYALEFDCADCEMVVRESIK